MNTKEIKAALKALPIDQRKQLLSRSSIFVLKQWQTWLSLLVYGIMMVPFHLLFDRLGFSTEPINIALLVSMGICFPIFFCTFDHQRRKSIIRDLKDLQQDAAPLPSEGAPPEGR